MLESMCLQELSVYLCPVILSQFAWLAFLNRFQSCFLSVPDHFPTAEVIIIG